MKILVLGEIWQPGVGICAMEYIPGSSTLHPRMTGHRLTQSLVKDWLKMYAGDFQFIKDFAVLNDLEDFSIDWELPDSGQTYCDCILGT